MKIKNSFVLRNIAGINTVISADVSSGFDGMITLNETGVFMWNILKNGTTIEELIDAVVAEYDIDRDTAKKDTTEFVEKLKTVNVFE